MARNCFAAAMASIVSQGVMTKTETGAILAVFYLFYAIFQVPGGVVSNRYNPEKLLTVGVIVSAVTNIIIFFFHDYWTMMIVWTINAISQFCIWPSVFRIISTQLHEKHRHDGIFYITLSFVAGLVFAYAVAAFVTKWEYNFLISAIVLLIAILVFMVVYKSYERQGKFTEAEIEEHLKKKVEKPENESIMKIMLRSGLIIMLPLFIIQTVLSNGLKVYTPLIMMESYSLLNASFSNAINVIVLFTTAFGVFVLKLIHPKRIKSQTITMAVLYAFIGLMTVILTFIGKIHWLLAVAAIILALVPLTSLGQFTNVLIPKEFEKFGISTVVAGIVNAIASLGIFVSNYGVAYVADNYGWKATFLAFIILLLVGFAISLLLTPRWTRFVNSYKED